MKKAFKSKCVSSFDTSTIFNHLPQLHVDLDLAPVAFAQEFGALDGELLIRPGLDLGGGDGFAVREAFFVSFLGSVGVDADAAFAGGFLFFLVTVCLALPGGAILLWESVRGGAPPEVEHG